MERKRRDSRAFEKKEYKIVVCRNGRKPLKSRVSGPPASPGGIVGIREVMNDDRIAAGKRDDQVGSTCL